MISSWSYELGSGVLDEAERAVLDDEELFRAMCQGLAEFAAGECVSSDWLFAGDSARAENFETKSL